jgi:hypothetical protein
VAPADLPPWLRQASSRRPGGAGAPRRTSGLLAGALLLLAAGGGAGYLLGLRRAPHPAPPPVVTCPPPVACAAPPAPPAGRGPAAPGPARTAARHGKPAARTDAPLLPLPDRKPMDEGQRTQALRAFAAKRAPELRDCLEDPGQGPPVELGAAIEINANGAVDLVQILGADASPRDVRRCYATHLKKWRFPEELLRGEEKLLVNFVL